MKATLKNYRQAPRKVRLIADLIKGKKVEHALATLSFLPKRAALPVKKLLESAIANAKERHNQDKDTLMIKNMRVDKGFVFMRHRARARGRSAPIRKRTSHISVELEVQQKEKRETPAKKSSPKKLQATSYKL